MAERPPPEPSKRASQVKRLKTRVRNLQNELAKSVPKAELETLKASLETRISDLEAKLAHSVQKEEADHLRARVGELESKLGESIPKHDAEAELESVKSKLEGDVQELERKLAASSRIVDSMRADLAQLQGRLAESMPKAESEAKVKEVETKLSAARADLELARATIADFEEKSSQSSAKIEELQAKVSDSVPRTELETTRRELQSKITGLEEKLASSVPRSEADAIAEKANRLESALTEASEKLSSAETRIRDLESRLTESVPKAEAEAKNIGLKDRLRELESKLSESVPRRELDAAKAQAESMIRETEAKLSECRSHADALKEKVAELGSRLAETEKMLEVARSRIKELEAAAAKPPVEEVTLPARPRTDKELAQNLMKPVPEEKSFRFHTDVNKPTGISANSLEAFCRCLLEVEPPSVSFHLERGDLQDWLSEIIGDTELSSKLSALRGLGLPPEELKIRVYSEVKARCDELSATLEKQAEN